ncbi:ABC transporter [Actinosynnema sp. ALI-1.44]|uniref:ATP-binding cassette domain-containing protein n=1 Tax=Actinosynnema sp. ALI-1.44 TaxID=1933779 RepID=UPI00097C6155|nr:ATP-binding cassette domain-containing protein [Actinosynnema sp. ALI-1.44]ONI91670.1 ABC transporter [Actinosynnema sp. ALI-1.44]
MRLSAVGCRHGRRTVVDDVHLDIEPGQRVALTGTNGSGKTTLLRAVIGLHQAATGVIEVGGHRAATAADWARRRKDTAWIPQRQAAGRFPLLAEELLESSGAPVEANDAATQLGVGKLRARPLDTLSGGQLQRMYLARAMGCIAAGAGLLLADEPTAALDFDGQADAARLLTSLPVTVLVVTHDRVVVDACERVLEMAAGRLREVT